MKQSSLASGAALRGVRVLVTGGTGALGQRLVWALRSVGADVAVLTRSPDRARRVFAGTGVDCRYADLTVPDSLVNALASIELVFHLASHTPPANASNIYHAKGHWAVTAVGSKNLVAAAVSAGVKGFVYFSSVKAMGDAAGAGGRPADESATASPETLYGQAKLAAEDSVLAIGNAGPMHVCVLRLPMVYGLDGRGNLARMIEAIAGGRFPPWPRVANRRSAVCVYDVIDAALLVATDGRAAGKIFLLTDAEAYSTRWLYEQICVGLGRPVPRWTLPLWCWRFAARLGSVAQGVTGKTMPLTCEAFEKLSGDAWYSSVRIRNDLSFAPRHSLQEVLPDMVAAFLGADSRCGVRIRSNTATDADVSSTRPSSPKP